MSQLDTHMCNFALWCGGCSCTLLVMVTVLYVSGADPVPPSEETQGCTDRYISTWLRSQKREDIVLATKVLWTHLLR